MISRQNPLHVTSCHCHGYRFWGGLSLSRVLWKSAYSRSNMKPKSIPKQARTWIEALLCWFQALRQHFIFLSFCMRFLSSSFHYLLICLHFAFIFLQCAFMSIHLPFICIYLRAISVHVVFMSFHFLSKVSLWLGQRAECNK